MNASSQQKLILAFHLNKMAETKTQLDTKHRRHRSAYPEQIGVWEWDLVNDSVYYSAGWQKLRGCDGKELKLTTDVGNQWVHPDDKAKRKELHAALRAGEIEQVEIEHRVKVSNGSWRNVVEWVHAIVDNKGVPIRLVGCELDLPASPGSQEEKLQRNSRSTSEVTPLPVAVARLENNCANVKEHGSRLTGQPLESALGHDWIESIHPEDQKKLQDKIVNFANDPKQIVLDAHETRQVQPDGSTCWVQCHLAKEINDDGSVTGYYGTLTNIDRVKRAETELRELNQRLHRVLDYSSIGIWEWDWEGERLVWDQTMHEIYGVDVEDFRGSYRDWSDRIHPDDIERVLAEDQCRSQTNQQFPQEFRIVRPNGEVRHIYSNACTELNEFGNPVRTTGVNLDITERRETEFALLESESKLRRITKHIPGMVYRYFWDADGNSGWSYVSPQVHELFGIETSELMENKELLWQLIDDNDMNRLSQRMHESATDLSRFVEEFRITTAQSTRWFQSISQPQKTDNGSVFWDGVILEITDRKRAEIELKEAKHKLERITENVPGMIFRQVYPQGGGHIATFISSKSTEMFGVAPQDGIADSSKLWQWIHPEDIEFLKTKIKSSVHNLEPLAVEYRVIPPSSSTRWYHVTGQPEQLENGDVTLDGVVLDVTDRKDVELANDVLAKATRTKDEFLANMSHELRTPLTAILAMTDGLKSEMFGKISPKQLESLMIVEQSGVHLLDLINELLDLAKIESGQLELDFSAVNLSKLCESCLNFVTQQAEQKQIELSLNVPWNLPQLEADEKRIRQVLINLLSNAVKFTTAGGQVKLKIETLPTTDLNSETLRISVSDTGIGIKADQLESLFDPFVQVDSSLTRQHGGTGLGLSLAKQYVELHEGKIHVTSEPGKGSCFIVDLPFRKPHSGQVKSNLLETVQRLSAREQRLVPETSTMVDDDRPLILLAEDNSDIAMALIPILEYSGFNVLHATNGKAAIQMAREHSPDLILMDVQMPEMDGLAATRQIREIPELRLLPIIAISGFARSEDARQCAQAGMDLFMAKPLRIKELVVNIKGLLSEHKTAIS